MADAKAWFDIFSALVLLATALIGAYVPRYLGADAASNPTTSLLFHLGNMLSGGVMLSAGFCHLLADALRHLTFIGRFPIATFLAAVGYIITLVADQVVTMITEGGSSSSDGHHGSYQHLPLTEQDSRQGNTKACSLHAGGAAGSKGAQQQLELLDRRDPSPSSACTDVGEGLPISTRSIEQQLLKHQQRPASASPRPAGAPGQQQQQQLIGSPSSCSDRNGGCHSSTPPGAITVKAAAAAAVAGRGVSALLPIAGRAVQQQPYSNGVLSSAPGSAAGSPRLDPQLLCHPSQHQHQQQYLVQRHGHSGPGSKWDSSSAAGGGHLRRTSSDGCGHTYDDEAAAAAGQHVHTEAVHNHFEVLLSQRHLSFATALLLAGALCIHSILEGIALGAQASMRDKQHIMLAIVAHKGLAAYALGSSIMESKPSVSKYWTVISLFSLATPVGIGIGMLANRLGPGKLAAAMSALASGTFLYVALMEVIPKELAAGGHRGLKMAALLLGFGAMSLLAVWA